MQKLIKVCHRFPSDIKHLNSGDSGIQRQASALQDEVSCCYVNFTVLLFDVRNKAFKNKIANSSCLRQHFGIICWADFAYFAAGYATRRK